MHPHTMRLTAASRQILSEVALRTERPYAWLAGEALAAAAVAIASAPHGAVSVLGEFVSAPPRGDQVRTSIMLSEQANCLLTDIVSLYSRESGARAATRAAVLRAVWMRWAVDGADAVVATVGAVRPWGLHVEASNS